VHKYPNFFIDFDRLFTNLLRVVNMNEPKQRLHLLILPRLSHVKDRLQNSRFLAVRIETLQLDLTYQDSVENLQ
jgi:hypothetical protein